MGTHWFIQSRHICTTLRTRCEGSPEELHEGYTLHVIETAHQRHRKCTNMIPVTKRETTWTQINTLLTSESTCETAERTLGSERWSGVCSRRKQWWLCINTNEVHCQPVMLHCCHLYLTVWGETTLLQAHLISCGHDGHHGEFLDLHLCDSHGGQEADLRRAHVGALCKHTLAALDVMTDWPRDRERERGKTAEECIVQLMFVCSLPCTVKSKEQG